MTAPGVSGGHPTHPETQRKGCERCHDRNGHEPVGDAECALWAAIKADVRAHAAALDMPPLAPAVDDLLAHLNSKFNDKSRTHRAAFAVLDLGWRPVVVDPAATPKTPEVG